MAWTNLRDSEQDSVPGFDPRTEKYIRLDLDRWLKKHNVSKKAKEHGTANQPPSDASSLDATELEIVDWINYRGRRCREDIVRHLSDFERELAHLENDQELIVLKQEVHQTEKKAEIALERKVDEGRNALTVPKKEVSDVRQDFKRFKEQSGLTRLPDYSHRSTVWMFILACVIVEIVLNASLLMDVMPSGLLGAIGQMALISGFNVVICGFPMGELLRLRNHVQRSKKIVSWLLIFLIMLPIVALFNLAVGHFRDSIQVVLTDRSADVFQAGGDALRRLFDAPLGLDSFHSVLLAVLGIACFGFASWKWLQRDDPYPDYGRRDRQMKLKEKDYVHKYNQVQDELGILYLEFESKLKDIRHQLRAKQSNWREMYARGKRLVQEYPVNLAQYQHDLDYLMNAYRTANTMVRTSPIPPHFSRLEKVDAAILDPPSFTPPAEVSIQGVMDQVHATISQLQLQFRDSCKEFPPLDEVWRERTQGGPG